MAVALALQNSLFRTALRESLDRLGHEVVAAAPALGQLELDRGRDSGSTIVILTEAPTRLASLAQGLREIRRETTDTRCVVLDDTFDLYRLAECFSIGCSGLLLPSIPPETLSCALRFVASGHRVYPDGLAEALNGWRRDSLDHRDVGLKLTDREQLVGAELAQGQPNKAIARHLSLSQASVKLTVQALQRKLGSRNRTQVAIALVVRGLVPTPRMEPVDRQPCLV